MAKAEEIYLSQVQEVLMTFLLKVPRHMCHVNQIELSLNKMGIKFARSNIRWSLEKLTADGYLERPVPSKSKRVPPATYALTEAGRKAIAKHLNMRKRFHDALKQGDYITTKYD